MSEQSEVMEDLEHISKSEMHWERIDTMAEEIANGAELRPLIAKWNTEQRVKFESGIRYCLQKIVDDEIAGFSATGFDK